MSDLEAPDPLEPLPLVELRRQDGPRRWQVHQPITGLESLTPVRGELQVRHHGQLLEVEGQVATIVTLCCDRCLQHFNHPLRVEARDLIEVGRDGENLDASAPTLDGTLALSLAAQLPGDAWMDAPLDLDARLDPEGSFDPERWLFEQLSLQLPIVNRCGADCPGPPRWSTAGAAPTGANDDEQPPLDPRWAALRQLRSD